MNKADIIAQILNTILESGDIDGAILKLSNIIDVVTSQEAPPQSAIFQVAFVQEPLLN